MSIISWKIMDLPSVSTKVYSRSTTIRDPLVFLLCYLYFQFSSVAQPCPALCDPMLQHARPHCPMPTSGVYSNLCTKSVMPSNDLFLCQPLLLLPSIFSSIRVFSNESVLRITRPKYWSFSFSISP